ncbi:carbohydrate ABC transporter permease [Microbacterium marinilacus]|uniref:Sugar ABC transporter permease n=1 Tax=Microbacterium marinilacus TaxID=415209 RepID=A0ABP7BPJ5_9MICO|nr:sugar ABC transporter permease [Microbacterium marinilacus]
MSATSTAVRSRRRMSRTDLAQARAGYGFLLPFLVVFGLVMLAPVIYAVVLSLFQNRLIGGMVFVGADNFVGVLTDPQFLSGLGRVLLFLVVQVPIMLGLALFAALAIDSARLHGASFFRLAIFLPYAVPGVVAVLMWGFIYGDRFGLVGNLNRLVGSDVLAPLSADWLLLSIGNIVTWQFIGYNMLIFFAALKAIPHELYEAAEIDGAGQLRIVTSIKIPSIRGAVVIASIFSIIGSFQLFNEPNILKTIVPNLIPTYYTPNMYAYNLAFLGQQPNYAATVALIMGVVTAVIAYAVQLRGSRKDA